MTGRDTEPLGLIDAVDGQVRDDFDSMPSGACRQLLRLGRSKHRDFTWGFRIYRTGYTKPN
jgi:hypothetical protein